MTKGALRNGKAEVIGRENGNAGVELGVLEVPIIEGGASPEAKDAARDAALDAEPAEGVGGAEAEDAPGPAAAREEPAPKPVPYFQLFRYATPWERVMVGAGLVFGLVTSIGLPVIIILYGEYTTLLVDRNMENVTSSRTHVLDLFGGGRVLVNGSWEQRREALLEDSAAFGLGALAAAALQSALAICCISCLNTAAHRQVGRVRRLFLRAVLRQEMAWFDTRDPSAFASRLTEDLDKMQDGIGEKLGMFMYLIVSFVGSVIMSFLHGWKLTLVVLTCAPVIIVATALVAKMQGNLAAREQQAYGAAGAAVEEALAAIRTVVAFHGQRKEAHRYAERLQPAEAMGCKRGLYTGLGSGVFWFIVYASYSLAFWYGVELILEGRETGSNEYTPAVLVIVLFGVLSGAMNMGLASPHLEAFAVAQGAAAAVFAVLERAPLMDPLAEGGRRPERPPRGDLTLRAVRFSYPARPHAPVLRGLDLSVRRGETVALVGASGCGKSTVVQLLQRLYDPQDGQVLLDGEDVRELNLAWLRSHVGVVGQEPALFAVSIAENIRYGREDATRADIEAAAKEASAHDFITRLPQGYDTEVGERGAQLSGGQKQRIAIARALVRNPRILLLDEATSALDSQSEALVQRALERAARGRTTVVVAHRLSTIAAADRIVCLADGRVVEQGTHAELLARRGHYYALVAAAAVAGAADEDAVSASASEEPLQLEAGGEALPAGLAKRLSVAVSLRKDSCAPDQQLPDALKAGAADAAGAGEKAAEEAAYDAPLGRIMRMNRPEWPHVVAGCAAAAVVGAALPFFAILFGEVYRALSLQEPEEVRAETRVFAGLFLVVGVMAGGGTFVQMHMLGVAGTRLTSRLRREAFAALLRQEAAFFDEERHGVGVLCARLAGDAASVQGATGSRIGSILQAISTLVIGVLLALYYSWKLTLVSVLGVPLVFAGVFLEARVLRSQGLHEKEALESASKVAVEVIANIRTVASLGGERAFLRRYGDALAAAEAAGRAKMRWRGVVFAMGQCSPFLAYALTFYYGGFLAANEGLSYEKIIKVSEALLFGAWMLGQTLALAPSFSAAKLAAGRLFALLDRQPAIVSGAEEAPLSEAAGRVEYEGVEFAYPTRPEARVLRGLRLQVPAGATVALVGPSGCGKSTCLQLLQRLYDPLAGSVLVDGRATTALPLEGLRAQLGIVSQEPVLFDRTIAENIAYGDNARAVPMDEVIAAAKAANIHAFIAALPQGYETRLGAKGTQLSGGQKQRVAIARALVRNPRILLLDEATSALDSQSEKVVQQALDEAQEGRTCIVIAHRLATVQQADLICVVNNGVIAETGTHSQLLARKGLYYFMHRRGNHMSDV
ncbi:hypothetical protein R5R35_001497 [Gryllus longicercus]|uniref:ABC-type xenobiotic transporter n=1 Tax=Gryllus longicercus TaxID=2509291 RepID=A0AAN9W1N8_9ORTH